MKTKELIRRLNEADPSGELECVVGTDDIFFVESQPMYYDGRPVLLIRDPSRQPYYDVIGLRVPAGGSKVQIRTLSVEDVDDNTPIEYDVPELREQYEESIKRRMSANEED